MRNLLFTTITFLSLITLLSSCAAKRQLADLTQHQTMLQRVSADESLSAEVKMDSLASSFIRMMDEGLSITNPKRGIKYVKQYNQMNKGAINQLVEQIVSGTSSMDKSERTKMGIRVATKPYVKDLIRLVPKFSKKYAQLKFVAGLTKKVKRGVGSFGGKFLQGMIENL